MLCCTAIAEASYLGHVSDGRDSHRPRKPSVRLAEFRLADMVSGIMTNPKRLLNRNEIKYFTCLGSKLKYLKQGASPVKNRQTVLWNLLMPRVIILISNVREESPFLPIVSATLHFFEIHAFFLDILATQATICSTLSKRSLYPVIAIYARLLALI